MIKNTLMLIVVLLGVISCKSVSIYQKAQTSTTKQLTLGSIGLDSDFIFQTDFNNTAIPVYNVPIKLSITAIPFDRQSHKQFVRAKQLQAANIDINYLDSIANKPKYLNLKIADRVAVLDALNANENRSVKDYLKNSNGANVLTGLSYAMNDEDINKMLSAEAVFLVKKGHKTYVLELYEKGIKGDVIHFNDGVVFSFETSACCWQENNKHQLNIVDLADKLNGCPYGTYRSSKRAEKKVNYYKL